MRKKFLRFVGFLGSSCFLSFLPLTQEPAEAKELPYSFQSDALPELNFGVVKNNSIFKIYRSEMLGHEGLEVLQKHLQSRELPFPKTIVYMNTNGYSDSDSRILQQFYRQTQYGYTLFHSFLYSYRTYLDGGNPLIAKVDIDSGNHLGAEAQSVFGTIHGPDAEGGIDAFERILKLVLDPARQPVLFHCLGGRHRTGMTALALRYIEGGEWLSGNHGVRVVPFFQLMNLNNAQYEYYRHNTLQFRKDNLEFIEKFFKEHALAKKLIAQNRHLLAQPSGE